VNWESYVILIVAVRVFFETHCISCTTFELFDVEECRDPESHSESLEMTPLDRMRTSFYLSSLVTMVIFCSV